MEQKQTPQTEEQTQRAWVTPVVETVELKDALAGTPGKDNPADAITGYS